MLEAKSNSNAETNGEAKHDSGSKVPEWVQAELFEDVLKETVKGYQKIIHFKPNTALAAGENYATIMLRVDIDVELEDAKTKQVSYMLKVPHQTEMFQEWLKKHNIFDIEVGTYLEIVPEFEQMYREAGVEVKFGAQCYKLKTDENYVLLEDLRTRGFRNANRLEGLDMDHTKCVLKKLAQWHAASATRIETKGQYEKLYQIGFFNEEAKPVMKAMNDGIGEVLKKCITSYKNHEVYAKDVEKLHSQFTDEFYKLAKVDPNEFNVLNHGDCWSNNIMFQYDAFGKIKETYFVDFQIPKYGTPTQDLLYFLLSSTKFELKLKQFEYFIKFYHDHLTEYLILLKYPKKLPNLRDIHSALYKYGTWGYTTATGVMAAVLLDPTEKANLDNFISDSEAGTDFKMLMYSNPRYRKHIEIILPWLHNRGALEC